MLFVNTPAAPQAPRPTLVWALFIEGVNAAIRGADLAEMLTEDEQEGWWYAHNPGWREAATELAAQDE